MTVAVVFLFATAAVAAVEEPAKNAKKDVDLLQGEWTMVTMEHRGVKAPAESTKRYTLTIKGDQWVVTVTGGRENRATFKLDPAKDPKHYDLTFKTGGKETQWRGIYKLEDKNEILSTCRTATGAERPKEFDSTKNSATLIIWKRAKK